MTSAPAGSILDDLPEVRRFDQSAMTVREIMEHCICGRKVAEKLVSENVATRKWEQVWKRSGTAIVKAYRRSAV